MAFERLLLSQLTVEPSSVEDGNEIAHRRTKQSGSAGSFNPRPASGAKVGFFCSSFAFTRFNPRPASGAKAIVVTDAITSTEFQSAPRERGERGPPRMHLTLCCEFQSAPRERGERRRCGNEHTAEVPVSIRAPRAGRKGWLEISKPDRMFRSAPRERGESGDWGVSWSEPAVSIRAPRAGRKLPLPCRSAPADRFNPRPASGAKAVPEPRAVSSR